MKKRSGFLFIMLTFFALASCSDNLLDGDIKKTCNLEGEPIEILNRIETKLFYYDRSNRPAEIAIFNDGIVYAIQTDNASISISFNGERIHCYICNFPEDAKKLKVKDQGLDIVLSGRVYESGDSFYKYMELTELKKK